MHEGFDAAMAELRRANNTLIRIQSNIDDTKHCLNGVRVLIIIAPVAVVLISTSIAFLVR